MIPDAKKAHWISNNSRLAFIESHPQVEAEAIEQAQYVIWPHEKHRLATATSAAMDDLRTMLVYDVVHNR